MNKDYYSILGVSRDADEDEIKKAYRRLAAKHHPDRGGSKEEFQRIEEAYRILSDPVQRQQHDQPQGGNPFGGGFPGGFHFNFGPGGFDDLFGQMFRGHPGAHPGGRTSQVYRTTVFVTLEQVYTGGSQPLRFQTHSGSHAVKIDIPRGVQDGMQLRYDNLIPDGSLIVEFRTHQHLKFERHGNDLHLNQKISVLDLIVGTTVEFTGLDGKTLSVKIPPKTQPTAALKIGGAGLPIINSPLYGDAYINIKAFVPDDISPTIVSAIQQSKGSK